MEHPHNKTIAGILVGSILANTTPLVIAIFAEPGVRHTLRVSRAEEAENSYHAAKRIIKRFYPDVRRVWLNDNVPNWYYLQIDLGHPPTELYGWALPIQAYGLWMDALAETQGLVRLSISQETVDGPVPSTPEPAPWYGQGKADDD